MRNTLGKRVELTEYEIEQIREDIARLSIQIDTTIPGIKPNETELEQARYQLSYLKQLLTTSNYWTLRGKLTIVKGGKYV
jgi:hypothetical protein